MPINDEEIKRIQRIQAHVQACPEQLVQLGDRLDEYLENFDREQAQKKERLKQDKRVLAERLDDMLSSFRGVPLVLKVQKKIYGKICDQIMDHMMRFPHLKDFDPYMLQYGFTFDNITGALTITPVDELTANFFQQELYREDEDVVTTNED